MGSVIGVSMFNAREGDRTTIISPLINTPERACLQVDHYVTSGSELDVFLRPFNETTRVLTRELLCALENNQDAWNTSYLYLPSGSYNLVFEGVIGDPSNTKIYMDNITLLNENCTKDEPITFAAGTLKYTTLFVNITCV